MTRAAWIEGFKYGLPSRSRLSPAGTYGAGTVLATPYRFLRSSYDSQADVLYINFKKAANATDGELTDDDVIIRYEDDEVIAFTVLHASTR